MRAAWLLVQLLACAALIGVAGFVLSRAADRLATALGWGRGWVGLALLATVTSLPELASGISAVALVGAPNLAVGNALGACVVNLGFLVVVDTLQRSQPMFRAASPTHMLSAGLAVVMLGFVALSLMTAARMPALLHVGIYSPALVVFYLLALRRIFTHERAALQGTRDTAPAPVQHAALRAQWVRFAVAAAVVLAAGTWLPSLAGAIAAELGVSRSFTGTVLMAVVTTLPEMAVTLAALRLGALDMAIGNLLGSNLFNLAILAVDDLFYTRGPLLAEVSPAHAATAATAIVMTGLVIVGLVLRPQGRLLRVTSWTGLGLAAAYAVNTAVQYLLGT